MSVDLVWIGVVTPILTIVMEVVKRFPIVADRPWIVGLVALFLGIAVGLVDWSVRLEAASAEFLVSLLSGILAGLGSVGLYEVGKRASAAER